MKPKALILWAPGTNCHREMALAFELAGAQAEIVLLNQLLRGRRRLTEADLIGLPGGFSFGDHFGAGRVAALDLACRLRDQLLELRHKRVPMLGICNGFQILVAAGLLPGDGAIGQATALLDLNASARFEHWINITICLREPPAVKSIWTDGLAELTMKLPIAHGEGRPVSAGGDEQVIATYPAVSPNGGVIAAICDRSGVIAGFMPHPERQVAERQGGTDGLRIFKAGVRAVS